MHTLIFSANIQHKERGNCKQGLYRSWRWHLEFNVEIFKAFKMIIGIEKSGKILENCNADVEMQMSVTLLITRAINNYLAVHVTKHLKVKV